jgi:hypothetical protein
MKPLPPHQSMAKVENGQAISRPVFYIITRLFLYFWKNPETRARADQVGGCGMKT